MPPGVLYDVSHQCRLQYGAYSAFCEDMDVSGAGVGVGVGTWQEGSGDSSHQPVDASLGVTSPGLGCAPE